MAKDGVILENTVAAIERALSGQDCCIERRSRRLRDKDTGKVREHDVLITRDHGHYQTTVAIECRDRSRKVSVPEVEAFQRKCEATGINLGVIVSTKGFYATARKKAEIAGIVCAKLEDIEECDWLDPEFRVDVYECNFGICDSIIMFRGEQPECIAEIRDANGEVVSAEHLARLVGHHVPKPEDPSLCVGKTTPVRMKLLTQGWEVSDGRGRCFAIDHIAATTSYTYVVKRPKVRLQSYETNSKRYVFAHHDLKIGQHEGHIVFFEKENEVFVHWTKDD